MENGINVSQKNKWKYPMIQQFLDVHQKEMKAETGICKLMFKATLFTVAKRWNDLMNIQCGRYI